MVVDTFAGGSQQGWQPDSCSESYGENCVTLRNHSWRSFDIVGCRAKFADAIRLGAGSCADKAAIQ